MIINLVLPNKISSHYNNYVFQKILTLLWTLALFVACWSPLESLLLYAEYASKLPRWWPHAEWLAYFLAYTNTAINPYIYAMLSGNYKSGLRRLADRFLMRAKTNCHDRLRLSSMQLHSSKSHPNNHAKLNSRRKSSLTSQSILNQSSPYVLQKFVQERIEKNVESSSTLNDLKEEQAQTN